MRELEIGFIIGVMLIATMLVIPTSAWNDRYEEPMNFSVPPPNITIRNVTIEPNELYAPVIATITGEVFNNDIGYVGYIIYVEVSNKSYFWSCEHGFSGGLAPNESKVFSFTCMFPKPGIYDIKIIDIFLRTLYNTKITVRSIVEKYDDNDDGKIDSLELLKAIQDWQDDKITGLQLLAIINSWRQS